ncbi:PEP-CTERM sorting domain-containing protein [Desulfobacter latus]|uniref:PEP-CTERM sorting domain-containing protein n=1 Tax=Desulfobacter latus TaxID=2292 RepID=A0A850TCZ0_9BACT|nr:PEP-CTERM sorting domain-containing protein [Desulfobacter latus]NWH06658.1 PEP-CTERM sorting domain-containing protein [Desulfobacter latus]
MKKNLGVLLQGVLLSFFFLPAAYSAPNINGVMSYTDSNDWGNLGVTTTTAFSYSNTVLNNVVVEEQNAYGSSDYDVEELGLYIEDNVLYIGLQTEYDLSHSPDSYNVSAGDFIFMFGDSTDNKLRDYNNDQNYTGAYSQNYKGDYDYAFAFDFTVDDNGQVDITYLSGTMAGTGVGTYANNYGTDYGIASATSTVNISEADYSYGYSETNSGGENGYYNGQYTLELAIDLDSLSDELNALLSSFENSSEYASVAMYWQPSCGNDFLAASSAFNYTTTPIPGAGASPTPEPATLLLFGMGLLGAGAVGRRKGRL